MDRWPYFKATKKRKAPMITPRPRRRSGTPNPLDKSVARIGEFGNAICKVRGGEGESWEPKYGPRPAFEPRHPSSQPSIYPQSGSVGPDGPLTRNDHHARHASLRSTLCRVFYVIFYRQHVKNRINSHDKYPIRLRICWTHASTLAAQY